MQVGPTSKNCIWLLSLFCLGLLSGCGDTGEGLVPVRGTVTLDGIPLSDAEIIFRPANGRPSLGKTDSQGKYQLRYSAEKTGVLVGTHAVTISTAGDQPDDEDAPTGKERVPAEYNTRTTLTAEVKAGLTEPINFDLTSTSKAR